jgi:uncharacterized phiE125 gp8 family phage protein
MTVMKLVTPPSDLAVSLAATKKHLIVEHAVDDDYITTIIKAATRKHDGWSGDMGLCLMPQVWRFSLDAFPCGPIRLPLGPFIEMVSFAYVKADGSDATLGLNDYSVDADSIEAWLAPAPAGWPGDVMATMNAVQITYRAGHEGGIDEALQLAIMQEVATAYKYREDMTEGTLAETRASQSLLGPRRRVGF